MPSSSIPGSHPSYRSSSVTSHHDRSTLSTSHPQTSASTTRYSRPRRPNTAATSTTNLASQEIIVAVSESRGISPIVGLAILNISSAEVVLCQICDTQTYVRTVHKLSVFGPSEILFANTAQGSKLMGVVEENVVANGLGHGTDSLAGSGAGVLMTCIDRRYWNEGSGIDYLRQLALEEDVEALQVTLEGNYYAASSFAAVMKYVELGLSKTFAYHSLRIKFEPSQGSAMIDLSTIASLELIQNLRNARSKHCLLGLLNETLTPMGSRILKGNILQPFTDAEKIQARYDALEELASKEQMFHGVRDALKGFVDTDRVLSQLVLIPIKITFQHAEQSINTIVQLKTFIDGIKPIWQALTGAVSQDLVKIRSLCAPDRFEDVRVLIEDTLNQDVTYSTQPLELRNQRTYAIKAGVNGFLDVARQTYKEANEDAFSLINELDQTHELSLDLKYEPARSYYIRIPSTALEDRTLPEVFINVFRKKNYVECQTLVLMKINQRITDAHNEVINTSDATVQSLTNEVRNRISPLFKISESIGLLDMLASFTQVVTTEEYVKPELVPSTFAIKSCRHPLLERIQKTTRYIPNDVYATPQSRFQIITGCNMSGKSTYIRSIALMTIMAQIGCFVPATYASFPITHQIFARISTDDNVESNVSTFSAEMRETAFILSNIESRSLILVDELGRGTSITDGLAIAIAIAEALISSGATVFFITHFRDLPRILSERSGVINLHLSVDISATEMKMLYKVSDGPSLSQHYGLTLARLLPLPPLVLEVAEQVSHSLSTNRPSSSSSPQEAKILALAKKRKLILSLTERLHQARNGKMRGQELRRWLKDLQDEFALRMCACDMDVDGQAGGEHIKDDEGVSVDGEEGEEEDGGDEVEGDRGGGEEEKEEGHQVRISA